MMGTQPQHKQNIKYPNTELNVILEIFTETPKQKNAPALKEAVIMGRSEKRGNFTNGKTGAHTIG
jgi:hypothetical protein